MFERFTDRARRVMVLAQEERSPEGVREKVDESMSPAGSSTTGSPPLTPRAKKVLELSLCEALQLGHNYIGTEHMLLGLVREGEGAAAQVLVDLGADLTGVGDRVIEILSGYPSPETPVLRPAEAAGSHRSARRGGPRCPGCQRRLDGHIGYRVLPVPPIGDGGGDATQPGRAAETLRVIFV